MCSLTCWCARRVVVSLLLIVWTAVCVAAQEKPAAQKKPPQQNSIEWLEDADGRAYRLEPVPKAQAQKIDDGHVRTMWGVAADLAREDEQFFYIKIYKVGLSSPTRTKGAATPARPAAPSASVADVLPPASARLRWTPYGTGLPATGQWRDGLALVDITGDGRLDIVMSPARKTLRPPTVFVHDGTSSAWKAATTFQFPSRPYDYGDIAVGDLNGDGTLDLALGLHLRGLIALRGGIGGQFEDASSGLPFSTRSDQPVFSSRAILLQDCNADGRLDIVALGEGPRLPSGGSVNASVATGIAGFVQQADGSWTLAPQASPSSNLFGASIASGDVDGDGRADLAVAPGSLGDTRLVYRGGEGCGWQAEAIGAVRPRSYITAVAAADVNGDRRVEVIAGYTEFSSDQPSHGVDVLTRAQDGTWSRRALAREPGRARIEAIAAGDVDGDTDTDIAILGEHGTMTVFLGDGRGAFTRERQQRASPGRCEGSAIAIGDLDRDGLSDLVVSYAQESSSAAAGACPNEGGIVAWKTQRTSPATAKPSAKPSPKTTSPSRTPGAPPRQPRRP